MSHAVISAWDKTDIIFAKVADGCAATCYRAPAGHGHDFGHFLRQDVRNVRIGQGIAVT